MKKKIIPSLLAACLVLTGCSEDTIQTILSVISSSAANGWLADDENLEDIPDDVQVVDVDESDLATSVDISSKYPPIGNQGSYGTCVTWATGYAFKTALNAIDNNWSSTQLALTANQTSPADLWFSIDSDYKGTGCGGTNFEYAMTAMINNGVASLSTVPYSKITSSTCDSGTATGNSDNKLSNYRKIANSDTGDGMTVDNFKYYLNQGRPVVIGAQLGDRFMAWSSSDVISYDTYLEEGMQHAYHAMVLSGYDDSKQAFRVRNSWGTSWGDEGSIWVDYDFFIDSFVYTAFVGQNSTTASVSVSASGAVSSSYDYDLVAYDLADIVDDEGESTLSRVFAYEVYNSGNVDLAPSTPWTIYYLYYNASDADDMGIIYEDVYTDAYGGEEGDLDELPDGDTEALLGGYWNNMTVEAGNSVGGDYVIYYDMPQITGKYYLVLWADVFDGISEGNENNNFYFLTAEGGQPLEFSAGVLQNEIYYDTNKSATLPEAGDDTPNQSVVLKGNVNAYTPAEIALMIRHKKATGELAQKAKATLKSGKARAAKRMK